MINVTSNPDKLHMFKCSNIHWNTGGKWVSPELIPEATEIFIVPSICKEPGKVTLNEILDALSDCYGYLAVAADFRWVGPCDDDGNLMG